MSDSHSSSSSSEVSASELKVNMEPALEVEKVFRDNPLARARSEESVGSSFGGKDLGRGRNKLPKKSRDRAANDVVKSTFVFEANFELNPGGASINKFKVSVLPGRTGGVRSKDETEVLGGKKENDHAPINERTLEIFSAEFLEVALPKRNKDIFGNVERET